ncbi:MAG: MraY family glycosyltransferase [Longimicrobiaceae bacterium]
MTPLAFAGIAAAFAVAWALTGAARRYAVRRNVLDHPNERSSHTVPTPRGGGVAIVMVAVAAEVALWAIGWLSREAVLALAGGGVAVAAIGGLDDHRGVSAKARAAVHFAAAAWALGWLGGVPALRVGAGSVPLGVVGTVLAAFGIVWSTNLYNFMDGIDGIAGAEAVTCAVAGGVLLLLTGERGLAAAAFAVAAASAGFLAWNWHPARIFMGDAGSYFLGFTFAVLAVASERAGAVPLLAWMVLLGVFVFDATATLVRRARRGERWHEAHRSHAYQRAAPTRADHARVSGAVAGVNVMLASLAALGALRPAWLLPAVGAAALALAAIYVTVERHRPMYARRGGPDLPGSTLAPRAR